MLRRQPISNRQRSGSRRPARLGDHAAMAEDGARAITAAVEENQDTSGVTAWCDRPFARYPVKIDQFKIHIIGHGPDRANLVEALAPLDPSHRPRLGTQQCADSIYFTVIHRHSSSNEGLRTAQPSPMLRAACTKTTRR